MAFSTVLSAAIDGLNVEAVQVEVDIHNGLPVLRIIGYLSSEVKEAADRVRTAIRNLDISLPPQKIIVNLAPATVHKRGASFDLPIAAALMAALGEVPPSSLDGLFMVGELSLNARVKPVSGILPVVVKAREMGCHTCILPSENAKEGALAGGIQIIGVRHLKEVKAYLNKERIPGASEEEAVLPDDSMPKETEVDFADIHGQEALKRAAEVAVSGGHNLLMIGPPGSGKTMTAKSLPSILPPLTFEESLEITKIYSVAGLLDPRRPLLLTRPFRSVHHTATKAALIGGGRVPRPGEISLAHRGVLFLDELPEFDHPVLEALRQPLEEQVVHIARSQGHYVFPADFMLAAAMNPCPCGHYPDLNKCTCTPAQIHQYRSKISQPFLDRMDICIEVPRLSYEALTGGPLPERSVDVRARVIKAREVQRARFSSSGGITCNARMTAADISRYVHLGEKEKRLLKKAYESMSLTARSYHKILKVARTIADLAGEEEVSSAHLAEAIAYRLPHENDGG